MIERIGDRATFQALKRRGRRTRQGPIMVSYLPASRDDAPAGDVASVRAAFSVGRKVGPAVVRNKLRRRLRHVMRELDDRSGGLMPGAYLVTVQPAAAELSYGELYGLVDDACRAVGASGEPEGTST